MRVKMPLGMRLPVAWALMKSHRIGERSFKEIVVANRHAPKNVGEIHLLGGRQVVEGAQMTPAEYERFKWPERPEWHDGGK